MPKCQFCRVHGVEGADCTVHHALPDLPAPPESEVDWHTTDLRPLELPNSPAALTELFPSPWNAPDIPASLTELHARLSQLQAQVTTLAKIVCSVFENLVEHTPPLDPVYYPLYALIKELSVSEVKDA